MGRPIIEIAGKQFGMLTVVRQAKNNKHGESMWECTCACGGDTIVPGHRLRHGHTRSCGCLKARSLGDRSRTHGKSKTPEYVMYYDACKRSRRRKIPITVSPSDILIPTHCPVLGIELIAGMGLKSPHTPTLDCIDPSKGYVVGNIQVVSWRYNKFKADLSPNELLLIAKWVLR